MPLLYYVDQTEKFTGIKNPEYNNRPIDKKLRKIHYAGHLDSFIYKYYSLCLNKYYNAFLKRHKIDQCSTAYRTNKFGKSNINFSAEVINFIASQESAYIFIGDFSDFFGSLDHQRLKEKLIEIIGGNLLSNDWYNIFRSLTKYGYYHLEDIEKHCGTAKELREKNRNSYFESVRKFRKFQRNYKIEYNKENYGIPQGTAISGVFANVYAIEFDLKMKNMADKYQGLYRRYSDDFILILPQQKSFINPHDINQSIKSFADECRIDLQPDKTHTYRYEEQSIEPLADHVKPHVDYLGFIFDGKTVKIRPRSIYKFYRNMEKLINKAYKVKRRRSLKHLPYRKKIYRLYTDLGAKRRKDQPHGNFITYAKRAQWIFDQYSPHTKNIMNQQIKNRKKRIEKVLGYRIHVRVNVTNPFEKESS